MEIRGAALQPSSIPAGTKPQGDSSADIQKLEQLKQGYEQELKKLEQNKESGDSVRQAKEQLKKKIEAIEQQIQALKQQGTAKVQPSEDGTKNSSPRVDKYVKQDKEPSPSGLYNLEQDENGNAIVRFDDPNQEPQNKTQDEPT